MKRMMLLSGILLSVSLYPHGPINKFRSTNASSQAKPDAAGLTQALVAQSIQYQKAGPRERARLLKDLLETAAARRQLLLSIIEGNPEEVIRVSLTGPARDAMPVEAQAYVEEEAELEGELEVLHEDWPGGGRYLYHLKAGDRRYSLHFTTSDEPTQLMTGARIRVRGVRVETMLALGGRNEGSAQTLLQAPIPNALGDQRTLVMLVNFSDNPIQPYSVADAQNVIFSTTSEFFMENSYRQAWLSGNVVGWSTIPLSSTVCDPDTLASQARAAATALGFNLTAYTHHVYAFPQNACGWWGMSSVGGNPSQSWINGKLELGVSAHELGHGLGLWHSHSLDCGPAAIIGPACSLNEYGDILDMMGASRFAHFNTFQKERLGWLNFGASPPITTIQLDGTYAIETYENTGTRPKALKLPGSTDPITGQKMWYYVESRQAVGFDAFLANQANNVVNGVLIHTGTDGNGNSVSLLDMTPATPVYYWWYDPALAAGQSFTDPEAGMTITTESVTASEAVVTVRFAATRRPAVTLSADRASYIRSQTVTLTAKVTSAGSPVRNAAVSFTITKSNGAVEKGSSTTGANGTAVFKLRLKPQDPVGVYQANAVATVNSLTGSANTSFVVK